MLTAFHVITINIPGDGRSMMLPPLVLSSFAILIQEHIPGFGKTNLFRRSSQHLPGTPAVYRYGVQFCQSPLREQRTLGGILDLSTINDLFPVGRKRVGDLSRRIGGYPTSFTSPGWHHEYIEISETIARESNLLPIRRPNRVRFVCRVSRQLASHSPFRGNDINISFITKYNLLPVR